MLFDFLYRGPAPRIALYEEDGVMVSTVEPYDAPGYETAVEHPEYNDGAIVIVGVYDSEADARVGHAKWVERMTGDDLPEELVDVGRAEVKEFGTALLGDDWCSRFPRHKKGAE
jgi:hypothetical protein